MSNEGEIAESVLEKKVAGEYTTFRIYLFMLRVNEASPRQVYREMGLSSPSLALHHLEKLEKLKLVSKDRFGKYHVISRKFGVLKFFLVTGRWLVPRTLFYLIFFIVVAVGSMFVLPSGLREFVFALSLVGVITNLIETWYFYRLRL